MFVTLMLSLLMPATAEAGAKKIPIYDASTEDGALKASKKLYFRLEGKPKTYPKKVAIGAFHARFVFNEKYGKANALAGTVKSTTTTLEFDDATYQALTTALYEQLAERLRAEGFEVVPREEVVAAATYQALEGSGDERENDRRAVHVPDGMKNMKLKGAAPMGVGKLAALNNDLGTDAVVSAFVNIGICTVDAHKKTEGRSGVYACLRGSATQSGFDLRFLGKPKDNGKTSWKARMYKEFHFWEYNKKENMAYDMALIAKAATAGAGPKRYGQFYGSWSLNADQSAFVGGASDVYDDALAIAFSAWESKNGSKRKAAGLERREPGNIFETVKVAPGAAAPPAEPKTFDVPALPGEVSCWTGKNSSGDIVLRRGLDKEAGKVVEDSITYFHNADPYRAAAIYEGGKVKDTAGAWEGSYTGTPWEGSWSVKGKMGNGATFENKVTLEGDAMTTNSVVTANGNTMDLVQNLTRAEAAACDEPFTKMAPPPGL